MNLWAELHHLFDNDDGSLPDIFIKNITSSESEEVYFWVMSLTKSYGEPTLWSLEEERDIKISEITNPVSYYFQGKSESFRHGLEEFEFNGTKIPQLTIAVNETGLEFDYRMGKMWRENELVALFEFLYQIKLLAPGAEISQAYEGGSHEPNIEFARSFDRYVAMRNCAQQRR